PNELVVVTEGRVELGSLRRFVPAAPADLAGGADIRATAHLDRRTSALWRGFEAKVRKLSAAGASAERVALSGGVSKNGPATELDLSAKLQGVQANGQRLRDVDLTLQGPLERSKVRVIAHDERDRTLSLTATLDAPHTTLHEANAKVSGHGVELQASARRVRLKDGGLELDELKLEGAGDFALS